ncbi:MAG: hypothetical protein ABR577_07460 [Pyrinomonadaceae bacterium]
MSRWRTMSRIEYILLNRELRAGRKGEVGVEEVVFGGKKYSITPERQQIVDLLISVYGPENLRGELVSNGEDAAHQVER